MHLWNAELSLCRESERGHTTPQTHTRNTWIHPHLKRPPLSSCVPPLFALKHTHTHTHTALLCSLPASACRCPSGPGYVFAAAGFDLLFGAAVLQSSRATASLEGWRWRCGRGGELVLVGLTAPPQGIPHHLSSSSHMCVFFWGSVLHQKYSTAAPALPSQIFSNRGLKLSLVLSRRTRMVWRPHAIHSSYKLCNASEQSSGIHWNVYSPQIQ